MPNKFKKLTIVTWLGAGNYGTCLQSFALNKKLENSGYDVHFLSFIDEQYSFRSKIKYILRLTGILNIIYLVMYLFESVQVRKRHKFQKMNYHLIEILTKESEMNIVDYTDCFITGSDQIWNTCFRCSPSMFLSFAADKKRVAYASSIGARGVKSEYKDEVRSLLNKFSHIGVREQEAVTVLSELTGRDDIRQVVDPTFLLTPNDWSDMSKDAEIEIPIPQRYILCYLIGNNDWYESQLQNVRCKTGINDVIVIPSIENPGFTAQGAVVYKEACPVEFVYLIQHAVLVCTDSFHATALSINHSVPFVEFMRFNDSDEQSQNSRIYDLLGRYHLMDRIYKKDSDAWLSFVDYQPVQEKLAEDRKSSLDYLINAIEN